MEIDAEEEAVEDRARRRLRELRLERGLTLAEVSSRAHLALSTLSRIETGKRRLSLHQVPVLAAALGVSSDDLLGSDQVRDPRVRGQARTYPGMEMWPLSERTPGEPLNAFEVHIKAWRSEPPEELPVHEGHEWLYVLTGQLRLLLGTQDLTLTPGEAAEFSTLTPHWFGAKDGDVRFLMLVGAQGDRLHFRG